MNDTLSTSQTIKAPDVPIVTNVAGDTLVQVWAVNDYGQLVKRKVLVAPGVESWRRAREILNDPAVVHWEALWHGNTGSE